MTYKGFVKGKSIELEDLLPFPEGQVVNVSVEPLDRRAVLDSPSAIRKVMHELPHLKSPDVDEWDRAIEKGKLPVRQENVFDVEAE